MTSRVLEVRHIKSAKAIGLEMAAPVLAQAGEVIGATRIGDGLVRELELSDRRH
jgi:hypothetical protein